MYTLSTCLERQRRKMYNSNETNAIPRKLWLWISFGLVTLLISIAIFPFSPLATKAVASNDNWPMYLSSLQHSGYNGVESTINPNTVTGLKQHWSFQTGGSISAQAVVANGHIYFGSWDG